MAVDYEVVKNDKNIYPVGVKIIKLIVMELKFIKTKQVYVRH